MTAATHTEQILPLPNATVAIKSCFAETDRSFALLEYTVAPYSELHTPHWHNDRCEAVYLLEGSLTITLNDEEIEATPGNVVVLPIGAVHQLSNQTAAPVRFVLIASSGSIERYVTGLAVLQASQPGWSALEPEALTDLERRYDTFPAPVRPCR